ncbi:uncharacterized protein VTP21DRAFT_194 [Calcarisporiella thermophila]|uniref:uncharacterized protein n=1 Tax=Calcarisporiella thermophila TaxID=911321 RepID=UPI00374392AC
MTTSPSPINSLTVDQLRERLAELGLDSRGLKQTLKKRLRNHVKNSKETQSSLPDAKAHLGSTSDLDSKNIKAIESDASDHSEEFPQFPKQPFDYYLFFDVEATCEKTGSFDFPNEIIEFPVILVEAKGFSIVEEFHSYVKPSMNPKLSEFCIELTGIQQSSVDQSPLFPEVLIKFQDFLARHSLFRENRAVFVTDGPWDIRDFITKQCKHSSIPRPTYFSESFVNLRLLFSDFYGCKERNIPRMLKRWDVEFNGKLHSGLDDSRNLTEIARRMARDGCVLRANQHLKTDGSVFWIRYYAENPKKSLKSKRR